MIGNVGFVDELYGVVAIYTTSYPLDKAAEFIGGREVPSVFEFWVAQEEAVFKYLTSFYIIHDMCSLAIASKEAGSDAVIGGLEKGESQLGCMCCNDVIGH